MVRRARLLRKSVGCDDDGTVFVMSGTIDLAKKAQDLGLEAFARLRSRVARPVGLLLAGAGKELQLLEQRARELNVDGIVQFLGWQEPDEMNSVYLAADVLLHPANYDPFPLVVVEAMSFGRAVIGSDQCGSVQERVRDGVNGYSFRAGHLDELVAAMSRLAEDHEHLISTQLEARRTADTWPLERGVDIVRAGMNRLISAAS